MHLFFDEFPPFAAKNTQIQLIQMENMPNPGHLPEIFKLFPVLFHVAGKVTPATTK